MTPRQKEYVRDLKIARGRIARRTPYICWALDGCKHELVLKKWIRAQLGGIHSYCAWLQFFHPDIYRRNEDFKQGRLQWIDAMIAELEK